MILYRTPRLLSATRLHWTNIALVNSGHIPFSMEYEQLIRFCSSRGAAFVCEPNVAGATSIDATKRSLPTSSHIFAANIFPTPRFRLRKQRITSLKLVKALLTHGARPTETLYNDNLPRWRQMTVFANFLCQIYLQQSEATDDQYRIMEVMIEHGAVSGLRLWHNPISDDGIFLERLTVLHMLRILFIEGNGRSSGKKSYRGRSRQMSTSGEDRKS